MSRRAVLTLLLAASAAATAFAADNPFLPKSTAGAAIATQHDTIEFTGISQMGKTTHLIFQDKAAKKNRWVAIGETVEGISVLNFDARLEQVVVKIHGTEKTLALRKSTGPVNTAPALHGMQPAIGFNTPPPAPAPVPQLMPAPAPVTPPNADPSTQTTAPVNAPKPPPNTPEGQAKAETEARMLVSDLLEIGMAQRKAYEEQQRRAAEGKSGQPAPAVTTEQPK